MWNRCKQVAVGLTGGALAVVLVWPSVVNAGAVATFDNGMQKLLQPYLQIHSRLAADSTDGVAGAARAIEKGAETLDTAAVSGDRAEHYRDLAAKLSRAAATLAAAPDLAATREAYKALSRPMAMWAAMAKPDKVVTVYCPMAKASWLQAAGDVRNPYLGADMLGCGQVVGSEHEEPAEHKHDMKHPMKGGAGMPMP